MERVAFLVEETGERVGALLNPAALVVRRMAGVRPRRSAVARVAGGDLADDPLLATGGGTTEIDLELLFDVAIAGSSATTDDVRDLTGPLWRLAENVAGDERARRPPLVRFVWGKAWNVLGVLTAVAERLERFTAGGVPQRSWLRARLVRVAEPRRPTAAVATPARLSEAAATAGPFRRHEVQGGSEPGAAGDGERLDQIAHRYFRDPACWRLLAELNRLEDPLHLPRGLELELPGLSAVEPAR